MIESFFASWELFHNAYLAGWSIAVLLALGGVIVIARDQLFVGAAISQASALGIACALLLSTSAWGAASNLLGSEAFVSVLAVVFSVGAALLTGGGTGESAEARTGWVFLVGASLSTLLLAHSPHGQEEIHRLVASTVIGARPVDVWLFGGLALLTAAALLLDSRRVLLVVTDPSVAEALGIRLAAWSLGLAVWLGVAVGLSIRASGVLYTFGCLVLPPLVARLVCRELWLMFVVSPAIALGATLAGFVVANAYDLPPAQLSVAGLCALLAGTWLWSGRTSR